MLVVAKGQATITKSWRILEIEHIVYLSTVQMLDIVDRILKDLSQSSSFINWTPTKIPSVGTLIAPIQKSAFRRSKWTEDLLLIVLNVLLQFTNKARIRNTNFRAF